MALAAFCNETHVMTWALGWMFAGNGKRGRGDVADDERPLPNDHDLAWRWKG